MDQGRCSELGPGHLDMCRARDATLAAASCVCVCGMHACICICIVPSVVSPPPARRPSPPFRSHEKGSRQQAAGSILGQAGMTTKSCARRHKHIAVEIEYSIGFVAMHLCFQFQVGSSQPLHAVVLRPFRALLSPFSKPTTPTWHGAAGLAFGAHAAARRGRAPTEPGRWVGRGALGRSLLDTAPRAVSPAAALHRPAAGPVVFCCLHCLHVPMRAHATHTTCCYNAMRQYIS